MDNKKVASFIAFKRKELGLTQQQVANSLNVSFQAVSKWEKGIAFPNPDLILDLATLLGVSADELLRGQDMERDPFTYKRAGVNIHYLTKLQRSFEKIMDSNDKRVLNGVGPFASLYDIKFDDIDNPVLVFKTEDPGSKLKIALEYGYLESVCYDMVNHLVNDIIVMGAKPLAVLDMIFCANAEEDTINSIVRNISLACKKNDCSLIGGKTSIQRGIVDYGTYMLSSSIVGVVEKNDVIDGSKIAEGDSIIALSSSGLHTSGYSLVRLLMNELPHLKDEAVGKETFLDSIMKIHESYYKGISSYNEKDKVHGMAHITGGGIKGNLMRVIPTDLTATIDLSKIKVPLIFSHIKNNANILDQEMLSTFNCGVGLIVVIPKEIKTSFLKHIKKYHNAYEIGLIEKNKSTLDKVNFINKINW